MSTFDLIIRLVVAVLLGTVVGLDREYRVKDAGFRTHFLVSLGSALFMIVSQYGFESYMALHPGVTIDPSRIAAQVVSGIGFIGAGTIIFQRRIVRGLTTAASLWATAGIGMTAGAGMYGVASAATVLTLVGLEVLTVIFGDLGARRTLIVFSASDKSVLGGAVEAIEREKIPVISYEMTAERGVDSELLFRATIVVRSRRRKGGESFIAMLRNNPDITVEKIE